MILYTPSLIFDIGKDFKSRSLDMCGVNSELRRSSLSFCSSSMVPQDNALLHMSCKNRKLLYVQEVVTHIVQDFTIQNGQLLLGHLVLFVLLVRFKSDKIGDYFLYILYVSKNCCPLYIVTYGMSMKSSPSKASQKYYMSKKQLSILYNNLLCVQEVIAHFIYISYYIKLVNTSCHI